MIWLARIVFVTLFFMAGTPLVFAQMLPGGGQPSSVVNSNINISALMQQGRDFLSKGDLSAAANAFLQVVRVDSGQAEAFYHLAIIGFQRGDYRAGFEFISRSIELVPDRPLSRMALAKALGETRAYDNALLEYQKILSMTADDDPLRAEIKKQMNLIVVRRFPQVGDFQEVLSVANALRKDYAGDPGVMHAVASFYILVQRLDEAEVIYEELVKKVPRNPSYRYYLGNVYELKGMFEKAEENFERVTKMISRATLASQAKLKLALARARKHQAKGDLVVAEQQFNEALAMDPNNPVALLGVASIRLSQKRPEEAEVLLNKILVQNPLDIEARYRLATTFLVRGMFNKGMEHLDMIAQAAQNTPIAGSVNSTLYRLQQELGEERVGDIRKSNVDIKAIEQELVVDPSNPENYFKLAGSYIDANAIAEAIDALNKAIELKPGYGEAYQLRGELYERQRKPQEAMEDYKKALVSLEPGEVFDDVELRVLSLQGRISLSKREWVAAEEAYAQILTRKENDRDAMFGLASVAAQSGDDEKGVSLYLQMLEVHSDDPEGRINLAMIYARLADEVRAIEQFKKASLIKDASENAKQFALDNMKRLQRMINGFSYGFSYGMSASTQVSRDSFEYSSTATANVIYNYKINNTFRTSVVMSPGYSTYHIGQHDFMNISVSPTLSYDLFGVGNSFGLSHSSRYGVLREDQSVTRSQNLFYGLSWGGGDGVSYSAQLSTRDFLSEQNPFFDADTYTLNLSRQQRFYELPSTLGYMLTVNDNRQSLGNDYAYVSHGLSGRLNKLLNQNLSAYLNGSLGVTLYTNRDSSTSFQEFRRNWNLSFGMGVDYRMDQNFSFYAGYGYSVQKSNLEVGFVLDEVQLIEGEDARVAYQSGSLGDSDSHSVNFGIRLNL